jgi:hypothetical protein
MPQTILVIILVTPKNKKYGRELELYVHFYTSTLSRYRDAQEKRLVSTRRLRKTVVVGRWVVRSTLRPWLVVFNASRDRGQVIHLSEVSCRVLSGKKFCTSM